MSSICKRREMVIRKPVTASAIWVTLILQSNNQQNLGKKTKVQIWDRRPVIKEHYYSQKNGHSWLQEWSCLILRQQSQESHVQLAFLKFLLHATVAVLWLSSTCLARVSQDTKPKSLIHYTHCDPGICPNNRLGLNPTTRVFKEEKSSRSSFPKLHHTLSTVRVVGFAIAPCASHCNVSRSLETCRNCLSQSKTQVKTEVKCLNNNKIILNVKKQLSL